MAKRGRRPTVEGSALLRPPYPFELLGRCAGCGTDAVVMRRVYGCDVFRYRCPACLPSEPRVLLGPSAGCLHSLVRLDKPIPAPSGRPWRYQCLRCDGRFKVASGVVVA